MPYNLLSPPDLHIITSISLPVTMSHSLSSRTSPVNFTAFFPNNYHSISSCNNLGFQKLTVIGEKGLLQLKVKQGSSEIMAAGRLVEDDWVNDLTSGEFSRRQLYNESNGGGRGGGYRGGGRGGYRGGGRGGGRGGYTRNEDRNNVGYGNRESRGGGGRGSFGGGGRGSYGGGSRGRGRFGGENGGREEGYGSRRESGYENGRGGGGGRGRGGRFGGEVQRRNDGYTRGGDSSKESGGWGSFFSSPEGKEPYVRDAYRGDDRFGSSRRDDRFGSGSGSGSGSGRGRGGGRDTGREDRFVSNRRDDRFGGGGGGGGRDTNREGRFVSNRRDDRFGGGGGGRGSRGGGVSTSVNRGMERGSLVVAEEEVDVDGDDDEEGDAKLIDSYRDLFSDEEEIDDFEDDEEDVEEDVVLGKGNSVSLPKVSVEGSESYLSETRFDQCLVSSLSLKGIKDAGYEKMTVVQEATLPVILKGKDVLAKARTGTGKTVAFLLPSIEVVVNSPPVGRDERWPPIVVLVICPTRELASQAAMEANKLLKYHPSVGVQVVIGGTRIASEQRRIQANPCQILVATPGRLKDHILNTSGFATRIKGVKVLILDEADHLLDMGFRKDIENIIAAVPKQRQTLLFSATVPPEVRQICHIALKKDHEYINTVEEGSEETHTQVQQKYMIAPLDKQFSLLYTLLKNHIADDGDYKVLVFCTTAMVTKLVADLLSQLRLNVREIHSRKTQSYRTQVSDEFRKSKGLILVTSDVSARGVDYPDVTLVTQVGLPADKAQYIHRLGRTGRKGKEGEGILLLAPWEEFFLSNLRDIPISKADLPLIDPDTKKKVERALSYVDMKNKESAYQAWLGYYNSNKTVARDKSRLVELANEFSRSMGLDIPPALSKIVLGKMGLKNVPGLRFK